MGLTYYPYQPLQLLIYFKFIAYGYRKYPLYPFQWSQSKLNLPGEEYYTHKLPWVMKVIADGHLKSEIFIYVTYGNIIAHSEVVCWQSAKKFCLNFNSLGIQDESRKQTEPSLTQNSWSPLGGNSVTHLKQVSGNQSDTH